MGYCTPPSHSFDVRVELWTHELRTPEAPPALEQTWEYYYSVEETRSLIRYIVKDSAYCIRTTEVIKVFHYDGGALVETRVFVGDFPDLF